jgi:hypothetical protein
MVQVTKVSSKIYVYKIKIAIWPIFEKNTVSKTKQISHENQAKHLKRTGRIDDIQFLNIPWDIFILTL